MTKGIITDKSILIDSTLHMGWLSMARSWLRVSCLQIITEMIEHRVPEARAQSKETASQITDRNRVHFKGKTV